ncbi:hypothetical protein POTOM_003072 [Populus tomentosa]|uniref:Uncharacterized protein n=1 Tax=Populus tomentosa TaxID=118781 RepID=A0A8X8IZT4_POPTO|nr:hypothetical protein POTOM_003072 [Populus tomentosa]
MGGRGVIGDKWSSRVLWACAIGSVVSLYMVVVERQLQNRERMMAEGLKNIDAESGARDNLEGSSLPKSRILSRQSCLRHLTRPSGKRFRAQENDYRHPF